MNFCAPVAFCMPKVFEVCALHSFKQVDKGSAFGQNVSLTKDTCMFMLPHTAKRKQIFELEITKLGDGNTDFFAFALDKKRVTGLAELCSERAVTICWVSLC